MTLASRLAAAKLAGGQREVTILFADLRDFTPWVKSAPATEVVASLNAYFSEMGAAIRALLSDKPAMRSLPAVLVKGRAAEVGVYALD